MRCYSANVWETLIEALHVYWQVIKEKWPALLAVFIPLQLVMALYRFAVASSGAENLANLRYENLVATGLGLTIGLLAVAITIDHAFFKCTAQRRLLGGGIAAAWGRMMATEWLRMIVEVVVASVSVVAFVIVIGFMSSAPLTQLGGSASALSAVIACIILAPLVIAIVWILVRWSFAVVLSAIHPIMGTTAIGESSRFVRGRFACCFFLLVAARLVMAGISAIPNSIAGWYARGGLLGLPTLPDTVFTRTAAMFLGDLVGSFGGLFMPVALTTFWVRTVEPCDLPESIRRSGVRLLVVVLLVLGAFAYGCSGFFGVKAALRAREESAQQRAAQSAEMLKAIEQLQTKPIEQDSKQDEETQH